MTKFGWMVAAMVVGAGVSARAQAPPQVSPATAEAERAAETQAPKAQTAPANPFPAVNPKNFTATSPTVGEVNDFLKAVWGYEENREWSVAAIQKTPAPGVARVVVFVADKTQSGKLNQNAFFITPDGKHAIADTIIDFGSKPFEERRRTLQAHADGPGKGAANNDLLFVEFVDLLGGKSKEAQDTVDNLAKEFPAARVVFESLPAEGNPYSFRAAAEGVCVRKEKGDAGFFAYAQTISAKDQGLTAATLETALSAAVTAAGGDPKAAATCAESQAAKDDVNASIALGAEVGVEQTPVLVVNGRVLPPTTVPFETLKRIVAYQAKLDGLNVHVEPTLSNLK